MSDDKARVVSAAKRHLTTIARDARAVNTIAQAVARLVKAGTITSSKLSTQRSHLHSACQQAVQNYDRMITEVRSYETEEHNDV